MQIEARIILDEILEGIRAEEKIRDEIMDLMIHRLQKQKWCM
jgi:hypothetical protein